MTYRKWSFLLGLVLITMMGYSIKSNNMEHKTDEQTAAAYIQALGYTIVTHEGEAAKYTLKQEMLENLDYMQLWGFRSRNLTPILEKRLSPINFL